MAAITAALTVFLATDPGAAASSRTAPAEAFDAGTGSASALGYKINPINGNLSFGITVGESIAGHQNTAASGQSRAVNLGVIGVTLAGQACDGGDPMWAESDQPRPVIASTGEDGADAGKSEFEQGVPNGIEKFALANDKPWAQAITTIAPLGDPKTVFINGGRTISSSGLVNGNTREAFARTELGTISLGGGIIKLTGLAWEAINRTGKVNESTGSFSVGSIEIAGQKLALPGDGIQQITALKALLDPLGFAITPPGIREESGVQFVDPLVIAVVPSAQRDGIVGPIISALQPLRQEIVDALVAQDCGNATYVTVADLVLGSVSGAGALGLELGGVQATTAEIKRFQFEGLPNFTLPGEALPTLPPIAGIPSAPSVAPTSAAAVPSPGQSTSPAKPVVDLSGSRGGWLAAIGGLGIILLLATAEADRRKMQHALHAIPVES